MKQHVKPGGTRRFEELERRERELCVLMAWESKTIKIDDACRALGISRDELFELEMAAVGQGVDAVREAS